MTEQTNIPFEANLPQEQLDQQAAIQQTLESFVADTPAAQSIAERESEAFGFDSNGYDVYTDPVPSFGGGAKKFVSKADPSDAMVGLTWPHVGGPMDNPNRYFYNYALRPNGDIVGKVTVENSQGQSEHTVSLSANATDTETAAQYKRQLSYFHRRTQEFAKLRAAKSAPPAEIHPAPEEAQPAPEKARQSLGRRLIGRLSLRGK